MKLKFCNDIFRQSPIFYDISIIDGDFQLQDIYFTLVNHKLLQNEDPV